MPRSPAREAEPDFAISAHLLADIAVRWRDESTNMTAALKERLTEDGDALVAEASAARHPLTTRTSGRQG